MRKRIPVTLTVAFIGVLALFFVGLNGSAVGQTAHSGPDKKINNPDPVHELVPWQNVEVIRGELLVQFKENANPSARASVMDEMSAELVENIEDNLLRIRFDDTRFSIDEAIERISNREDVEFAEPNMVYWLDAVPSDPKFNQQWGAKKIKADYAWDLHEGDTTAVVAVIDSGIDMDHPDLDDNYAYGYDYYAYDAIPQDNDGHGTHTSGTAAGEYNNAIGVAGIAANCKFAHYRAGNKYLNNGSIISSINAARDAGALVISMSFGSGSPSNSIKNALNNAYNAGVVNVASAGNDGNTAKNYPAAFENVIAVASSTTSDGRSSFSTYGNWVDVAAPGSGIVSCYLNGGYANMSGTSMSCPHVAGMATLLYSLLDGGRTKANADIVRMTIEDTCVNVGSWVIHGRVDMFAAVTALATIEPPTLQNVSPAQVTAFNGGNVTLTGENLGSAEEVEVGGTVLLRDQGFTVLSSTSIEFEAPMAQSLGIQNIYVTNPAGTSNVGQFTYIETDPVQMIADIFANTDQTFTWSYGGGVNSPFLLLLAPNSATVPFKGYNILVNHIIFYSGVLNAAGTGSLQITVPAGYEYTSFYSQFVTFGGSGVQATVYMPTLILP